MLQVFHSVQLIEVELLSLFEKVTIMKIAYFAAILAVTLIAFEVSAQPPGKGGAKGKNATGQRSKGDRAKGARGKADGAQRDPAQLAVMMMKQFDKDGDRKLNTAELTSLLTSLRNRRGGANGPRGEDGQGKAKGKGKSKGRDGGKAAPAGGQKPKRPAAE